MLCAVFIIAGGILFAPRWGLTGIAFGMALSKLITFWPIQLYDVRRVLRAHAVPAEHTAKQAV